MQFNYFLEVTYTTLVITIKLYFGIILLLEYMHIHVETFIDIVFCYQIQFIIFSILSVNIITKIYSTMIISVLHI